MLADTLALSLKIRQNRGMKIHCLIRTQFLPITQDVAWAFFANPTHLAQLSPPWMHFQDESYERSRHIYPGMVLIHRVRPHGLFPCRWVSVISHQQEPDYFIDEQKTGPFKFWQHKHLIVPVEGGVEVRDTLHYALAGGIFGEIGAFFVRAQLERVFDYREQMLEEFFG